MEKKRVFERIRFVFPILLKVALISIRLGTMVMEVNFNYEFNYCTLRSQLTSICDRRAQTHYSYVLLSLLG